MMKNNTTADTTTPAFRINVDFARRVSFAIAQNATPILRAIEIVNNSDKPLVAAQLEMRANPAFAPNTTWRIESLPANQSLMMGEREICADKDYMKNLHDAERGQLVFCLRRDDEVLAEFCADIELQPRDDLMGDDESESPQTPKGRIDRWQSKLLDLSLRNRLLNFKGTRDAAQFLCPQVAKLEDKLANGKLMRVVSFGKKKPDSAQALDKNVIGMPLPEDRMTAQLTGLYRKAKSNMAEGGANTLFLAAGFLRWRESDKSEREYCAPIVLIPAELTRKSANAPFRLGHYDDDTRINHTLLEFLSRKFDIRNTGLEGELPRDQSGIDLPKIFTLMRRATRETPGFEVDDKELYLDNFSFAKYLMWKDLVDRAEQLRGNRLVGHLIDNPEKPYSDAGHSGVGGGFPQPKNIDGDYPPGKLVTPLPADSSQQAAIAAAGDGRDMVIEGPPGTGKSQTIANIITHCLARKKTVLFVAEKTAALDVVHRRLKAYGLGDTCLELHSNKSERRRVLEQLRAAWQRDAKYDDAQWREKAQQLTERRDRLNSYVEALHQKGSHGVSIFEAIGIVGNNKRGLTLDFGKVDAHNPAEFAALEKCVADATRAYRAARNTRGLESIAPQTKWTYSWQLKVVQCAKKLRDAAVAMIAMANDFAERLGQPKQDAMLLSYLDALCQVAAAREAMRGDDDAIAAVMRNQQPAELEQLLARLKESIAAFNREKEKLVAVYTNKNISQMRIDDLYNQWREANAKMWPASWLAKSKMRKLLQSWASEGAADPKQEIEPLRQMAASLRQADDDAMRALPFYNGIRTNVRLARTVVGRVVALNAALDGLAAAGADADAAKRQIKTLLQEAPAQQSLMAALLKAKEQFDEAFAAYNNAAGGGGAILDLASVRDDMQIVIESANEIRDWVEWVGARRRLCDNGLELFVSVIQNSEQSGENGQLAPALMAAEFRRAYMRWWAPLALDARKILLDFSKSWAHEHCIKEFRELDKELERMASRQMLSAIADKLPPRDGVARKSPLGVLNHQLNLQRPSISIRKLIMELGGKLTDLTPCVLMSPLSVAQYLSADQAWFDVVIFDEASQITTWDAIGAIARGKQSIIVGDPKQLPPTNFFGRAMSDDDDDELEEYEKDLPSILDEASASGVAQTRLKWHYRSRNETLIMFSNYHYYDNSLITFPSPSDGSAVHYHKVAGVYDRGKSRTNQEEARAIVERLVGRLRQNLARPQDERETFGVITFNAQQQALILDLLDKEREEASELEWYFDDAREEPVIVKNIENIQGDERDVMLFSITFGRDRSGKITMSFGAINKDGGQKRLNVAVTRSRAELHIFASIGGEDIDDTRTRSRGVRDLKRFLEYAEHGPGALVQIDDGSVGSHDSPFEKSVDEALQDRGWVVRPQIGVSGFRVDLGVVHPQKPGVYLAGVECDGATYHSSATARDRDRIREEVLRNLGWSIIRIWSTDWFHDPQSVAARVHKQLEELLAKSPPPDDAESPEVEAVEG